MRKPKPPPPLFDASVTSDILSAKRLPLSALERQHRHRESAREISKDLADAFSRVDWRRRAFASKSLRNFIVTYCMDEAALFEYEPFAETDRIMDVMQQAASSSTPYHLRITRGGGKTTIMVALAVALVLLRRKSFVVLAAAKSELAAQMVEDIAALITSSQALVNDFPEVVLPLVLLGGSMQRAASQRFLGKPTVCRLSRKAIRLPSLASGCPLVYGSQGGAIIMAVGFDAKVRGLRVGKRRPDFILLDDLQDDEMANNSQRVEDARRKIYKTFLRLGSSVSKPSVLMTSTPIAPDDLSESFASDQNFKTETFPLMLSMPSERAIELWREYKRIKDADTVAGRFFAHSENEFYAAHRDEMDEGAKPFWHDCFNRDGTEISAVQHAMNLFLEHPESFASEYQMKPRRANLALELPRAVVAANVLPGSSRLQVPNGYVFIAAATDINPSYALTTSIVAFRPDRTAFVAEHLLSRIAIDGKLDDTNFNRLVYDALFAHGRALAALRLRIHAWGVDASGRQFVPATAFAKIAASLPDVRIPCCAMMGRSQTRFNPLVRSRLRDPINATVLCGDEAERAGLAAGKPNLGSRWMFFDADKYKEAAQRALLAAPGAPGGCSLFAGGDHTDFAVQVTNEKLVGKRTHGDGRDEFVWNSAEPHDYLDTLAMCYAIAAHNGISGDLRRFATKRQKPKFVIR